MKQFFVIANKTIYFLIIFMLLKLVKTSILVQSKHENNEIHKLYDHKSKVAGTYAVKTNKHSA